LKHAEISLAAMANNHIMDYDTKGVEDTLTVCKKNGIGIVGIGKTFEDASKPFSVVLKGFKVAVLNFADNEFLNTTDGSYQCNPIDAVQAFYDISHARKENDIVIVILHAGNEFYELPSPRTKKLYRGIIDMGADAIISHHTHSFSGYEIYKSKPIFYGLGNFIYDWPGKRNSNWNRGYLVRLQFSSTIDFEIIPFKQGEDKPGVFHLNDLEKTSFFKELERLNLIIRDDKLLEIEYQKYCNSVFPMYDAFIEPAFGKYIAALRKRGLFPKLLSKRKRLLLLNLYRCESHREVLLRLLKKYE
jgi:poly-gamma-glutamate synthesis protein (capsule biosynthesis protein)